jgi:hypothetical protein
MSSTQRRRTRRNDVAVVAGRPLMSSGPLVGEAHVVTDPTVGVGPGTPFGAGAEIQRGAG